LGGVLGLSVSAVHDVIESEGTYRYISKQLLHEFQEHVEMCIDDVPIWPFGSGGYGSGITRGLLGTNQLIEWWNYVHLAHRAGFYALAHVNHAGSPSEDSDHAVIICGSRQVLRPSPIPIAKRIDNEVLVSCSSKHPEGKWVGAIPFLKTGGFNLILVLPRHDPRPLVGT